MGKILWNNDSELTLQRKFIQLLWWKENVALMLEKGIPRMSQGNPYLKDESVYQYCQFYTEPFWSSLSSLHHDANHTHTMFTYTTSHQTQRPFSRVFQNQHIYSPFWAQKLLNSALTIVWLIACPSAALPMIISDHFTVGWRLKTHLQGQQQQPQEYLSAISSSLLARPPLLPHHHADSTIPTWCPYPSGFQLSATYLLQQQVFKYFHTLSQASSPLTSYADGNCHLRILLKQLPGTYYTTYKINDHQSTTWGYSFLSSLKFNSLF